MESRLCDVYISTLYINVYVHFVSITKCVLTEHAYVTETWSISTARRNEGFVIVMWKKAARVFQISKRVMIIGNLGNGVLSLSWASEY